MLFKPRKELHFSRRATGLLFLACGVLLLTVHVFAALPLLLFAGIFLYYASRWNLRIEVGEKALRFSENVLEAAALEIPLADLAEVRRVSEQVDRKGLLASYPEYVPFVEFQTRQGKVYRMHDIFPEAFDQALLQAAAGAGVEVKDFGN